MADGRLLQPGEPAPDFALTSSTGDTIRLSDLRGKAEVVLFFYPKDDSPACTAEACSFRDRFECFLQAGAEVIGISSDSGESHRRFAGRHGLPFHLLSDPDGAVRERYGVAKTFGLIPGRATFVIDREGIVRHAFSSQFRPSRHVDEALAVLEKLREGAS
jgi:thioredoxin-dependent peroxiredoxin